MNTFLDNLNKTLTIKKINSNHKTYFYNRNTLYVDLVQFLHKINEPLINKLNDNCNRKYYIINFERLTITLDCDNQKIVNSIFYLTNKYENYLLNTEIFVDSFNKSNFNRIQIHNSEDTNSLNHSIDIHNNSSNQNTKNTKPIIDYTSLEKKETCIKSNICDKNRYKNYNKWIVTNINEIPSFYKSNFELHQETSNNNYMFEGHRGLKASSVL